MLREVVENGYATALDELDYGIVSVAVPIADELGRVIAAINCSTSTSRVSLDEMVATRLPLLREAAAAISAEIRDSRALSSCDDEFIDSQLNIKRPDRISNLRSMT